MHAVAVSALTETHPGGLYDHGNTWSCTGAWGLGSGGLGKWVHNGVNWGYYVDHEAS